MGGEGPDQAFATTRRGIFVEGRNHLVRRAATSKAEIIYAPEVPASNRQKLPLDSLVEGTEVRVTAEQDGDGEWRAQRTEILKLATQPEKDHRPPRRLAS